MSREISDEAILLTVDGRGTQAKREALGRITTAARAAALEEAARLACLWCANGCVPEQYTGNVPSHFHTVNMVTEPGVTRTLPCPASRIWGAIGLVCEGAEKEP